MKSQTLFRLFLPPLLVALLAGALPAAADLSHARIVRLSLVEGDVRFTRSAGNDPLTDPKAIWETAIVNLPIQQGYALSTGSGRAEVEFESGATAYLDNNSMLEFYELALDSGARITQLVLRQGTASFRVNLGRGDVFSVTGGDFTAVADGRASFRVNNYDDGSSVIVDKGRMSVQTKSQTVAVAKGQSVTVRVGDEPSLTLGNQPPSDDFDAWVAARADTVASATNSAMRYVNSPYYDAGLADLYTYGSWFNLDGYGYCWQPIGVGFGWSPFASAGQWAFVPGIGWTWVSFAPWGWLPYHFGGWMYSPIYGWVWTPTGIGLGTGRYWRPVTAVWVRSGTTLGLVPLHPMDARGKTPINLAHGVIRTPGMGERVSAPTSAETGEKWKVVKKLPQSALADRLSPASVPMRASRTVSAGNAGARAVTFGQDSSIVYDGRERKFVNANGEAKTSTGGVTKLSGDAKSAGPGRDLVGEPGAVPGRRARGGNPAATDARTAPAPPRTTTPPPAPTVRVSPPPRSSGGARWDSGVGAGRSSAGSGTGSSAGSTRGGGGSWGSGGAASSGGGARPAPAPSAAPRPSSGSTGRPH